MIKIRKKDKKVVLYLAMIGALVGAYLAVLMVIDKSTTARQQADEERQFVEEHEAVMQLEQRSQLTRSEVKPPEDIVDQVKGEYLARKANLVELEKNYWVKKPFWMIVLIGIAAGFASAAVGFLVSWIFLELVFMAMFACIRKIYSFLSRYKPGIYATNPNSSTHDQPMVRNTRRIFPRLIETFIILLIFSVIIGVLIVNDLVPFVR